MSYEQIASPERILPTITFGRREKLVVQVLLQDGIQRHFADNHAIVIVDGVYREAINLIHQLAGIWSVIGSHWQRLGHFRYVRGHVAKRLNNLVGTIDFIQLRGADLLVFSEPSNTAYSRQS